MTRLHPISTLFPYTTLFRSLEAMTDLPKEFRQALAERAVVEVPEPERAMPSADGSRKLVWALAGGSRISSVLMPDEERSEEHTSELQLLRHLVCRLLLEKKK